MAGNKNAPERIDIESTNDSFLFGSKEMRWLQRIERPSVVPEPEEEPYLEPAWRDSNGEYHYCRFHLIHRDFRRTTIREMTFVYEGQPNVDLHEDGGCNTNLYHQGELDRFLRDGWPKPKEGATMKIDEQRGQRSICVVIIFCDDLFLCPECGRFHGDVGGRVCDYPWVVRDRLRGQRAMIDHRALYEFIESRRSHPEFQLKKCGNEDCEEHRAHVIHEMKEAEAAAVKNAAPNVELPAVPESILPPPIIEQVVRQDPYIYVIEGNGHFKIGIAKDVKKRMKALQTSSPFRLSIVNAWKHSDASSMEELLHSKYRQFHCSGEWFKLHSDQVQAIRNAEKIENLFSEAEMKSVTDSETVGNVAGPVPL